MRVFIVWVFFYVWAGVSKSVLGQILCLFLIVKRDSENSLSFILFQYSLIPVCVPERHGADHVTLVWIHKVVQVWNGSCVIVWGQLQNLNSNKNLLDKKDLSSCVSDNYFRSVSKGCLHFSNPDHDIYFDRDQLWPCNFFLLI